MKVLCLALVAPGCPWHRNCIIYVSYPSPRAGSLNQPLNEETTLHKSVPHSRTRRSRIAGFSMVEMAVSLSVLMILTAIAIPTLMRSFRTYQLNDAAARLSGLLKFTRFEAVRRNRQTCFLTKQNGYAWTLGTDSICSGTLDTNGKQQVITGFATLLPGGSSGLPGQGAICN